MSRGRHAINLINTFLIRADVTLGLDNRLGRCRLLLTKASVDDARAGMSRLGMDLYILCNARCSQGGINPSVSLGFERWRRRVVVCRDSEGFE